MATNSKISLKHGYTIRFNEDGTFYLEVETEDYGTLGFDGTKNGNIIDTSDFCEEDEPYKVTLQESIDSTKSWFEDWSIDEETIDAIIEDITPWLEKHAITEEEDLKRKIASLERIIAFRRNDIGQRMRDITSANERIEKAHKEIEEHTHHIFKLNQEIEEYQKTIDTLKASLKKKSNLILEVYQTDGKWFGLIFDQKVADEKEAIEIASGFYKGNNLVFEMVNQYDGERKTIEPKWR